MTVQTRTRTKYITVHDVPVRVLVRYSTGLLASSRMPSCLLEGEGTPGLACSYDLILATVGGYKLESDEEPVFKLAPISFKDKKLANYDMRSPAYAIMTC